MDEVVVTTLQNDLDTLLDHTRPALVELAERSIQFRLDEDLGIFLRRAMYLLAEPYSICSSSEAHEWLAKLHRWIRSVETKGRQWFALLSGAIDPETVRNAAAAEAETAVLIAFPRLQEYRRKLGLRPFLASLQWMTQAHRELETSVLPAAARWVASTYPPVSHGSLTSLNSCYHFRSYLRGFANKKRWQANCESDLERLAYVAHSLRALHDYEESVWHLVRYLKTVAVEVMPRLAHEPTTLAPFTAFMQSDEEGIFGLVDPTTEWHLDRASDLLRLAQQLEHAVRSYCEGYGSR